MRYIYLIINSKLDSVLGAPNRVIHSQHIARRRSTCSALNYEQ